VVGFSRERVRRYEGLRVGAQTKLVFESGLRADFGMRWGARWGSVVVAYRSPTRRFSRVKMPRSRLVQPHPTPYSQRTRGRRRRKTRYVFGG
jgi:hypothetical protein